MVNKSLSTQGDQGQFFVLVTMEERLYHATVIKNVLLIELIA